MKGVVNMIKTVKNSCALVLSYKVGVNSKNQDVFETQRYSKINGEATADAMYTLGRAIEKVMAFSLSDIKKSEDYSIVEAEA